MRILFLQRARLICLPVLALMLVWTVWATFGDLYEVHLQPTRRRLTNGRGIDIGPRKPLNVYLSAMRQREMFKQSVMYEVKKSEVVNILEGLTFLGIISEADKSRAFILNTKTGQSSLYSQGENIEDLTIKEIHPDRLVLEHGEEVLELIR